MQYILKLITIKYITSLGHLIPIYTIGKLHLNLEGPLLPGYYNSYSVDTILTPELDYIFVAKRKS